MDKMFLADRQVEELKNHLSKLLDKQIISELATGNAVTPQAYNLANRLILEVKTLHENARKES